MAKESKRVTFRSIHKEDTGYEKVLTVFCPQEGSVVSLDRCRKCTSCRGLCIDPSDRHSFLRCNFDGESPSDAAEVESGDPPRTPSTPARTTKLKEIMTSPVRCASPDTSLETLTGMFLEQAISAVPVVDAAEKPVGIVSKTDVLRRYYERGDTTDADPVTVQTDSGLEIDLGSGFHPAELTAGTVADVMTHLLYSLAVDASVSRAAALMAYEGVHRLVVTGEGGKAVGIVSSLDILRWMARWDGYVVPDHTRRQSKS